MTKVEKVVKALRERNYIVEVQGNTLLTPHCTIEVGRYGITINEAHTTTDVNKAVNHVEMIEKTFGEPIKIKCTFEDGSEKVYTFHGHVLHAFAIYHRNYVANSDVLCVAIQEAV